MSDTKQAPDAQRTPCCEKLREALDVALDSEYWRGQKRYGDNYPKIIKDALTQPCSCQRTPAPTEFGFASWNDGHFELIVRDRESFEETTLKGRLEPDQLEKINKILPTCVFVDTEPQRTQASAGSEEIAREAAHQITANVVPASWEDRNKVEFIYKTILAALRRSRVQQGAEQEERK